MDPIKNVAVFPNANVYFDGKCISHTIETSDGTRKSVGVILPSTLNFSTAARVSANSSHWYGSASIASSLAE